MKAWSLLAVLLTLSVQAPAQDLGAAYATLHATMADHSAKEKEKAAARPKAPEPEDETCRFCWKAGFKPLTEKARAVKAWEDKRAEKSAATPVAGISAIAALLTMGQSGRGGLNEYSRISREADELRGKAIALGGLELKDGFVRLKLVKDVDYRLDEPKN